MASGRDAVARRVAHLYGEGTVAGLTERQLLERFIARRDEVAFEALVARHGPMVLGVCRRVLRDPRDVEDAFQATFLVLVRRAGAIRDRELLAPWLHKVARRVATRAGIEAARRRHREGPGAEELADASTSTARADFAGDLRPAIDEELGRLPEKYRNPVVLCYLEGRTHEEAALQLHWPVGTVKGRLSRARDLLRGRLARRGLAPTAGLLALTLADDAKAAVPEALTNSTIQAATKVAAGGGLAAGTVPAAIASLAEGVARTMLMNKLRAMAAGLLAFGAVAAGAEAIARQFGGGGGFGGGAAVTKSDPGQGGGPGAGTGSVIPPGGDGPGAASSPAGAPVAGAGHDGGGSHNDPGAEAEAAAGELDEARVDSELLEIEVEQLKSAIQQQREQLQTLLTPNSFVADGPPITAGERERQAVEREKVTEQWQVAYRKLTEDYRRASLKLGRTKRLVNRLQQQVNANMGGGRMMGMMGGMQPNGMGMMGGMPSSGMGMAPMMGGMPGAMSGRAANAQAKNLRPGPAAKAKGRNNRPGPANAKPAAGARSEAEPSPVDDPAATKTTLVGREDEPDDVAEARETPEPPEAPRRDGEDHHAEAPALETDRSEDAAASELDQANTSVELLDLELQSLWQQLNMRLRSLKMIEEGDVEDAQSPAPTEDEAIKARERYEELRKVYQQKSLAFGRAKRQVRRLMSLLNEEAEPERRKPIKDEGMGGMGGGMGGMGGGMGGMGGGGGSSGGMGGGMGGMM